MIKQINGKIIGVTPGKSGTANKDGRSFTWQMYDVAINEDKTGQDFMLTAFDEQYQSLIGKEGTWTYKEETVEGRTGKQFTRRTLEKLPRQGQNREVMEELGFIKRRLEEINSKLDQIIDEQPIKLKENLNNSVPF